VILEGILTTTNLDGGPHVAPMGAIVDDAPCFDRLVLRPFQNTITLANLKRSGQAVFHVTDDVELLARAAVARLETLPAVEPAAAVEGFVLSDACRWFALRVRRLDDREPRAEIEADIVDRGRIRDFFGLNRAKHAVVEAAILATRIALAPIGEIRAEFVRLAPLVEKTGGAKERAAFEFLRQFLDQYTPEKP
jgi:hypothetical protein